MDWSGCDLIEVAGGRASGVPTVTGTRIPADLLLDHLKNGASLEEIGDAFPSLPAETLRNVLLYAAERLGWDEPTLVDWKASSLVEQVPGRCSGAPTIVGTRIFPDTIAKYYWSGATVDEIEEDYPSLSKETILELIGYVKSQEARAA